MQPVGKPFKPTPQTDEQWHRHLAYINRPDPAFDTDAAVAMIDRLDAWITETEALDLDSGDEYGGGIVGNAQSQIDRLEEGLEYGPHYAERGMDYGPLPGPIAEMLSIGYLTSTFDASMATTIAMGESPAYKNKRATVVEAEHDA
jgi:hypothetical protein